MVTSKAKSWEDREKKIYEDWLHLLGTQLHQLKRKFLIITFFLWVLLTSHCHYHRHHHGSAQGGGVSYKWRDEKGKKMDTILFFVLLSEH